MPIANATTVSHLILAQCFDEAIEAYESRYPVLPLISVQSQFDPLRDDPRFRLLLEKMGLPNSVGTL